MNAWADEAGSGATAPAGSPAARRPATPQPEASSSGVRLRNLWRVLQAVRAAGTTSRVSIARQTGLTATTVHRLADDLERRGLVQRVEGEGPSSVGRPPAMFRFDPLTAHVAGVDIGNETTRVALADLSGRVLARSSQPTSSVEGDLPTAIDQMLVDLQRVADVRRNAPVAVGVGVAAVTASEGTIVRASMHHLWEGLQLGLRLRGDLGCEVVVSQDDHLAGLAELELGSCVGLRDALVVNLGKGVGASVIAQGVVLRGAHGAVGRVGWITVGDEAFVDGPLEASTAPSLGPSTAPSLGSHGPGPAAAGTRDPTGVPLRTAGMPLRTAGMPLASMLTADGLIAEYRRLGGSRDVAGARDVFEADARGDRAACRAIDRFADRLGWLIASAVAILDPQRVVVGGGISGSFERLAPRTAARVAEVVALPPPIVASTLGADAVTRGALLSALRSADDWLMLRLRD